LRMCKDRTAIKAMLMKRHAAWQLQQGMGYTPPVRRKKRGKFSAPASST
jgi:hypothetical protein